MGRYDIAAVNLACAAGLPGADEIDADRCLLTLDEWATLVRRWTELAHDQHFVPHPEEYVHSEAVFRATSLVTCLQRHCGLRYDPAKRGAGPNDPFDFHEEFVHSAICGPGGTCATIPVVLAAVGRRLGYPIKLVKTTMHLFARWDDPAAGDRFNIQWCDQGMSTPPDDYYRQWPAPLPAETERHSGFLESLTPRRELAGFVARRGYRWRDAGNYRRAIAAFVAAADLDTEHLSYPRCVNECVWEWEAKLRMRVPPGFPRVEAGFDPRVRRWREMSTAFEHRIRLLEAVEDALDDPDHVRWWWEPLRAGRPPLRPVPRVMATDRTKENPCSTRA